MLKPTPLGPIPEETLRIGQQLLPVENLMRRIGDEYAELVKDEEFAPMYSNTGQPALSPARLALICVLQAMEHLSDRATVAMVRTRIDWKYALHLPLNDIGFDASVLSEFRDRLVANKAERVVFDRVLEKMKAEGMLKGRGLQRTDSLSIVGAVRELNRLELVMETMRLALEEVAKDHQEWLLVNIPQSWLDRYGEWTQAERVVKESGPKAKAETERLLLQTGRDGFELLATIDKEETPAEIRLLSKVQLLRQVWREQYRRTERTIVEVVPVPTPPDGISVTDDNKEPAPGKSDVELSTPESRKSDGIADMIDSPHDPQVRYSQKRGVETTGYKLQLTEVASESEPAIITDIDVVSALSYDGNAIEGIHQRLSERDLLPQTHLVDMAYVNGQTIVASENKGIELLGPVQQDSSLVARQGEGFSVEYFQIDFDNKQAFCPQGQPAKSWAQTTADNGRPVIQLQWDKQICDACPMRNKCVQGKKMGRTIKISRHYRIIAQRRREQFTPEFADRYRRRAGVEATLSHLVCCHGARQTPYRGLNKTRCYYLFLATAVNLTRTVDWQAGLRPKRNRISKLHQLMTNVSIQKAA
jgi:transposase